VETGTKRYGKGKHWSQEWEGEALVSRVGGGEIGMQRTDYVGGGKGISTPAAFPVAHRQEKGLMGAQPRAATMKRICRAPRSLRPGVSVGAAVTFRSGMNSNRILSDGEELNGFPIPISTIL